MTTRYATRSTTQQSRVRHPQSMLNNAQPLVHASQETNQTQSITKGLQAQIVTKRPLFNSTPHTSVPLHSQLPSNAQQANYQRMFQHHLTKVSPSKTFFLGHMIFPSHLQQLVDDIHHSRLAMASDGSVHAPNGSFSWVIYGTYSKTYLKGYNTLTGGNSDLSSFQAEACGYLGALYALKTVLTCFPPCSNAAHITSDLHIG